MSQGTTLARAPAGRAPGALEPVLPGPELLARPADAWPLVTVTILAYNRRDALRVTLDKVLRELDYPALEVIVVDNASADGTSEMLAEHFAEVRLLRLEENLGAPALNRAFAVGRGEWVLILDDDCYLEGDGLKRAVAGAQANRADLVSFRVASSETPGFFFNEDYPAGLLAFWGCSALVSARALARLGGYDPNIFIWGNEAEFTMRLLDQGWRHLFLPEVVSVHMKPRDWAPGGEFKPLGHRRNYRHWAYSAGKHLQPGDALRVLFRLAGMVALHAKTFSPSAAGALPAVMAGFAQGLRARGRPVRPVVSAVYRDQFFSYVSPLEIVRRPGERLRARGDPERALATREERWARMFAARRPFYPEGPAVLEL